MDKYIAKVPLQWNGNETIKARIEKCGEKITFENGDIHYADFNKAKALVGRYKKFSIVTEVGEEAREEVEAPKPVAVKKTKKSAK